ncbi:t12 [Tupaiid betaherpesvirus 1]|uniref:T12 n=1 Tax=Tupaiid herpesvirus 1 (strain 1) TaxID=10397 RepID=Q91TV1_TUHV1|nr:t12 [Tupaiid betaherpesvirus 1]AAK57036.1 t12 [Tupaiid betaherpesvirus 1]
MLSEEAVVMRVTQDLYQPSLRRFLPAGVEQRGPVVPRQQLSSRRGPRHGGPPRAPDDEPAQGVPGNSPAAPGARRADHGSGSETRGRRRPAPRRLRRQLSGRWPGISV